MSRKISRLYSVWHKYGDDKPFIIDATAEEIAEILHIKPVTVRQYACMCKQGFEKSYYIEITKETMKGE